MINWIIIIIMIIICLMIVIPNKRARLPDIFCLVVKQQNAQRSSEITTSHFSRC